MVKKFVTYFHILLKYSSYNMKICLVIVQTYLFIGVEVFLKRYCRDFL